MLHGRQQCPLCEAKKLSGSLNLVTWETLILCLLLQQKSNADGGGCAGYQIQVVHHL
jgi:hypothetical protein